MLGKDVLGKCLKIKQILILKKSGIDYWWSSFLGEYFGLVFKKSFLFDIY